MRNSTSTAASTTEPPASGGVFTRNVADEITAIRWVGGDYREVQKFLGGLMTTSQLLYSEHGCMVGVMIHTTTGGSLFVPVDGWLARLPDGTYRGFTHLEFSGMYRPGNGGTYCDWCGNVIARAQPRYSDEELFTTVHRSCADEMAAIEAEQSDV